MTDLDTSLATLPERLSFRAEEDRESAGDWLDIVASGLDGLPDSARTTAHYVPRFADRLNKFAELLTAMEAEVAAMKRFVMAAQVEGERR